MQQYKIAIIGSRETILGFKALGVEPVYANESKEAVEKLFELKKAKQQTESGTKIDTPKYAIIFIIEDLIQEISQDDYKKLTIGALPAIIPIPSHKGSTGFCLKRLSHIVEQAVGSDILN